MPTRLEKDRFPALAALLERVRSREEHLVAAPEPLREALEALEARAERELGWKPKLVVHRDGDTGRYQIDASPAPLYQDPDGDRAKADHAELLEQLEQADQSLSETAPLGLEWEFRVSGENRPELVTTKHWANTTLYVSDKSRSEAARIAFETRANAGEALDLDVAVTVYERRAGHLDVHVNAPEKEDLKGRLEARLRSFQAVLENDHPDHSIAVFANGSAVTQDMSLNTTFSLTR